MTIEKIACTRINEEIREKANLKEYSSRESESASVSTSVSVSKPTAEVFVRFDAKENPIGIMCPFYKEKACVFYRNKKSCIYSTWRKMEK